MDRITVKRRTLKTERLRLCLPPLSTYSLDGLLTLLGQPSSYWHGDYASAQEWNPLAFLFLSWHPLAAIAAAVLWALIFCAVIMWWRHPWRMVLAFVITFGHAVGASTWLARLGWAGYVLVILLLLGSERFLAWSWPRKNDA